MWQGSFFGHFIDWSIFRKKTTFLNNVELSLINSFWIFGFFNEEKSSLNYPYLRPIFEQRFSWELHQKLTLGCTPIDNGTTITSLGLIISPDSQYLAMLPWAFDKHDIKWRRRNRWSRLTGEGGFSYILLSIFWKN